MKNISLRTVAVLGFGLLLAILPATADDLQSSPPVVFIEAEETVDSGNSVAKAVGQIDFGKAIAAAILKKKTPVTVVTNREKAQWIIESTSSQRTTRIGDYILSNTTRTEFEASFQVVDIESSGVIFGYSVKRPSAQSAAEAFAENFRKHLEPKKK